MQSHPDADAFVRAILRDPADVTTRLVFADWLEETGEPANVAWAHFIRLTEEIATRHTRGSAPRNWQSRVARYASQIRATLTIPAALFVAHYKQLQRLLPLDRFTATLEGYEISREVIEFMPESVSRENLVLPLDLQGRARHLLAAFADPTDPDTLQKLRFILNREKIVAVRAEREDLIAAIDHHYGQTETESVDCVSYESPLIGLDGDEVSGEISGIFFTAFSRNCSGFEMELTGDGYVLRYIPRTVPVPDERQSRAVFSRLLNHFLSLPINAEYTDHGTRCLDFDIPLLSGRRFPVTLERYPTKRGASWFRVRFRWEDRE
jgi:uncharacterized protein (TIGR02996 family)